jgi:polysaccharide pyruvyl transferase CsaB
MLKAVIACASGLKNSGDEALLVSLLRRVASLNMQVEVLSLDPVFTKAFHNVEAYPIQSKTACRKALQGASILLLGGGGLVQDETSIYNPFRWLSLLRLAHSMNVPSMVYGNSMGPLKYTLNKYMAKQAFNLAEAITVRDASSLQLLGDIGVTTKVEQTQDPVFAFDTPERSLSDELVARHNISDNFVFFGIRHWFDTHPFIPVRYAAKFRLRSSRQKKAYEEYTANLAKVCDHIVSTSDSDIVFFSFCHQKDTKVAEDVAAQSAHPERLRIIDDPSIHPEVAISLAGRSQFVVGMRLHSIIYSIIAKKPFIALSYSQKVDGLLHAAGCTDLSIDINSFSFDKWLAVYDHMQKDEEEINARIGLFYQEAHLLEDRNLTLLSSLLDRQYQ